MRSFHTKVVGVTFANDDGMSRQLIISRCRVGEQLVLARDPENVYDRNAIKVCRLTGEQLGHLSRELAASIAGDVDEGARIEAEISDLTGGIPGKPTRGVNLLVHYHELEVVQAVAPAAARPSSIPRRRLSLTKKQRESVAGAELLALCQAITADGMIEDAEIAELRQWLTDHVSEDLPAIAFLTSTVERILADGKVTGDERNELFIAILKVLPPEVRNIADAAWRGLHEGPGEIDLRAIRVKSLVTDSPVKAVPLVTPGEPPIEISPGVRAIPGIQEPSPHVSLKLPITEGGLLSRLRKLLRF